MVDDELGGLYPQSEQPDDLRRAQTAAARAVERHSERIHVLERWQREAVVTMREVRDGMVVQTAERKTQAKFLVTAVTVIQIGVAVLNFALR